MEEERKGGGKRKKKGGIHICACSLRIRIQEGSLPLIFSPNNSSATEVRRVCRSNHGYLTISRLGTLTTLTMRLDLSSCRASAGDTSSSSSSFFVGTTPPGRTEEGLPHIAAAPGIAVDEDPAPVAPGGSRRDVDPTGPDPGAGPEEDEEEEERC